MPDKVVQGQGRTAGAFFNALTARDRHKKSRENPAFFMPVKADADYSASTGAASLSGRSTSSTSAIGALSPLRKPYFRMRK
jgi:hypothetical protein